jgi:hypothetical protein
MEHRDLRFPAAQKQESYVKPLVDITVKENKDKKAVFEAVFSKPNMKPKWFFKKDVGILILFAHAFIVTIVTDLMIVNIYQRDRNCSPARSSR